MYDNHSMGKVLYEGRVVAYNLAFTMRETSIIVFDGPGEAQYDVRVGRTDGKEWVDIVDMSGMEDKCVLGGKYLSGEVPSEDDPGIFIRFKKGKKTYIVETDGLFEIGVPIRVGEEAP